MPMSTATVIFPHQLFDAHPGLARGRRVMLVEEQLFFRDWRYPARFHQHKLLLHRASMCAYAARLRQRGYDVTYVAYHASPRMEYLFAPLRQAGIRAIVVAELADYMLEKRLRRYAAHHAIQMHELDSPGFLTSRAELLEYLRGQRRVQMTPFYLAQRRRLGVLLQDGKPAGGRWTFDTANRQPVPSGLVIPPAPSAACTQFTREAAAYVQRHFSDHPGSVDTFWLATTHDEAARWLQHFLELRLAHFGPYEDAMLGGEPFLFHSLLSPLINIGLLTPRQVLEAALAWSREQPVPLRSLEGFVRQIIGWREFVRGVYYLHGVRQRTANHFHFQRPMPAAFYTGTTGLLPLDTVIHRVQRLGFAHHIERLMILGNSMLLCELHPDAVYTWFMELFVDAYDWVMVPNVYGMSQYADGGLMTTKPYLSGSRYIRTMSDYAPGTWCEIWDAMYWHFIDRQRATLLRTPRAAIMPRMYDRLPAERRARMQRVAHTFLPG